MNSIEAESPYSKEPIARIVIHHDDVDLIHPQGLTHTLSMWQGKGSADHIITYTLTDDRGKILETEDSSTIICGRRSLTAFGKRLGVGVDALKDFPSRIRRAYTDRLRGNEIDDQKAQWLILLDSCPEILSEAKPYLLQPERMRVFYEELNKVI